MLATTKFSSIRAKLLIGFSILLITVGSMAVYQLVSLSGLATIVDKMHKHPLTVTRESALAYSELLKLNTLLERLSLTTDSSGDAQIKSELFAIKSALNQRLDIINQRILGAEGKQLAQQTSAQSQALFTQSERLLTQASINKPDTLNILSQGKQLEPLYLDIVNYAKVKGDGFYHNSTQQITQSTLTLGIILLVTFVIGIATAVVIFVSVITPIKKVTDRIRAIEKSSDLSLRINLASHCEIGHMSTAFDAMMATFHDSIVKSSQASQEIRSANQKLGSQSEHVSNRIDSQHQEFDQATQLIQDLSLSIEDVAEHAESTLTQVKEAMRSTELGDEAIHSMVGDMNKLLSSSSQAVKIVTYLQNDAKDIDSILDAIKAISEQTNLLALNAAIEAARAGEQGRGFAVVADEVRTLAKRTADSTDQVQHTIEKLQKGTEEVVKVISQNSAMITESNQKTQVVTSEIGQIRATMGSVSNLNTQMVEAIAQQVNLRGGVDKRIETLNVLANEAKSSVDEMANQNSEVVSANQRLTNAMARFKLG